MKKIISFIPVIFIFIILAVLFIFMCLPQNQSSIKAENGVLDLRGVEGNTKIAPLQGEWEFIYGKLLKPDEITGIANIENKETMTVPKSWDEEGYPLNGSATYKLTVLIKPEDEQKPLTLFLPEISSSYVLWVNGEIIHSAGTIPCVSSEGSAYFENALIPIRSVNGRIEIVLQVSNYHFTSAGINDMLLLGENNAVEKWFIQTRAFSCIALGCILMAAFYHLTLFIFRRREKTYLLFSLLCFLCFVRFLLETNGLNEYFQWIPMNMVGIRFYLIMFFLHSLSISTFSLYIFNRNFLQKYKFIVMICSVFIITVSIVMPTNTTAFLLITSIVTMPYVLFTIIMAARSPVLRENSTTRLYFAALIVFLIVGTSTKLFLDNVFFMPGLLSNMFLVMSQSLVLSRRYTDAFSFVEETNKNLEQIVEERTRSLKTANEVMLATNNAMKELITNISHDLKTPLAIMSLNLETLSDMTVTQSDADYQRYVRTAYQKNRDLQRLIQNLFEVSRIETNRNTCSAEWISLLHILAKTKERYDTFLEDKGIVFDILIKKDIEISADPQKIWSVIDNIIYNAARYTESGGSITICTQINSENQTAAIKVTDTGCGITEEHLPHIFERFYRVSQARSSREGESGLGLYIVKSIMDDCGGKVEIKSGQGMGTSIILTFKARTQD